MKLKQVNVRVLQDLPSDGKREKIVEYEQEKVSLIQEYMRLQDIVDQHNEMIYEVTCKIEQLNVLLRELE